MMIKVIAIDDEPLALQQVASYIKKIPFFQLCGECMSAIEAQQVEILRKNVEDTKALMASSSNTTYLEVIQAQSSLLNAEISKVTDDFYKMQAVVNLYQALGGGAK